MVGDREGVAGMTKFGEYPSNGVTPIGEQYLQVSPNAWLSAGENLYGMGWFTMPFYGHLTVELYAELDWGGDDAPRTWLSVGGGSSPPPNGGSGDMGVNHHGINIFRAGATLRTHAHWINLGAGAGVYAHARLYCTAGGMVAIRHIAGFWRPMAV
jgi:hypothetical protein